MAEYGKRDAKAEPMTTEHQEDPPGKTPQPIRVVVDDPDADRNRWMVRASFVVSLAAIGVAIGSLLVTDRHQRLTVEPKLTFLKQFGPLSQSVGILLANSGAGPARVTEYEVRFANETSAVSKAKPRDLLKDAALAAGDLGLIHSPSLVAWTAIEPGTYLIRNDRDPYVVWGTPRSNVKDMRLLRKFLEEQLTVAVTYTSVYRDAHLIESSKTAEGASP